MIHYVVFLRGEFSDSKGWIESGTREIVLGTPPPEGTLLATLAELPVDVTLIQMRARVSLIKVSVTIKFKGVACILSYRSE
jgi:hypothetical protein